MIFDSVSSAPMAPPPLATRALRIGKRVLLGVFGLHLLLGMISAHRAWFQVRRVDLRVSERQLLPGTRIDAQIVTSGRTIATLNIALSQNGHSELLGSVRVPGNHEGVYDFRTQRRSLSIVITPQVLAHFQRGGAIVRATALGSSEWLRTPPPTIRVVPVNI